MVRKQAYTLQKQIELLKDRGMLFRDEEQARHILSNISYYRLKGYWWDMQTDYVNHRFEEKSYFEDVVYRYNFDRRLKLILFDAIERIEIALRAKMIYHLSLEYTGLWYLNEELFGSYQNYQKTRGDLLCEFDRSKEIFVKDHKLRHPRESPEAWKILEVASFGTLSKLYKGLKHQLPPKSIIAKEMGLSLHSELSSWLESITYLRNIIAHHSQLLGRNMAKQPIEKINTTNVWLNNPLTDVQRKKPFLIISTLIYLCNNLTTGNDIKRKILDLFGQNPNIKIYKLGFLNNWQNEPLWLR